MSTHGRARSRALRCAAISLALLALLHGGSAGPIAAQVQPEPGINRPVSQEEIDRLRRQISEELLSRVEAVVDLRTESGDANQALHLARIGGRLNLRRDGDSRIHAVATRTAYRPSGGVPQESAAHLTLGLETRLTPAGPARFEIGATRFSTATTTLNLLAAVPFAYSSINFRVAARRANVEESLLSATGLRPATGPFAGQLVGRVMDNRLEIAANSSPLPRLDLALEAARGWRAGVNVASNHFGTLTGSAGYSVIARPPAAAFRLLRTAYEIQYAGFDEDRFGFGGASLVTRNGRRVPPDRLGSDSIPPDPGRARPGVGGYFSPSTFIKHGVFVEARGTAGHDVDYHLVSFVGAQRYSGSDTRPALRFGATALIRLDERHSLPVSYLIDNAGPFVQHQFSIRLARLF